MADNPPEIIPNKTVIGRCTCPSCGRPNTIRVNKSGKAFWCCRWPTGDDGRQCLSERRYSEKETAELMRTFRQEQLKMKGPEDGKETDDTGTDRDSGKRASGGVYDFYE